MDSLDRESLEKADILIVDDMPANLDLLTGILSERGYRVRSAINGAFALRTARRAPPDLIILDITMPDLSGYEVCQQLKDDVQTRDIPVIFISALDDALDKVRAFSVGGADYITKPFQIEEVLARVENQLMVHRLQDQLEHRVGELQAMTYHLQTLTTNLQRLNDRLQRELQLAHNIQQSLLPAPTPGWAELDVICYSTAAREVGGDWYAYAQFDPATGSSAVLSYALAVGDVSGKGMPAALLMAVSMASFRSLVGQRLLPGALLAQMDEAITDYTRPTGQNCACVYADVRPLLEEHTLNADHPRRYITRFANAACIAPLIKHRNGELTWVDVGGLPLGVALSLKSSYNEAVFTLTAGDMLIFISDGVVEATNAEGELLGFKRLEAAIRNGPHLGSAKMLHHIQAAVEQFVGGQEPHDDMTIVIVQL